MKGFEIAAFLLFVAIAGYVTCYSKYDWPELLFNVLRFFTRNT